MVLNFFPIVYAYSEKTKTVVSKICMYLKLLISGHFDSPIESSR